VPREFTALADRLERYGLSRTVAAALIVGVVGTTIVAGMILLAPLMAAQIQQLASALPADIERARNVLEGVARERLGAHFAVVQAGIDRLIAELQSSGGAIASAVAAAVWSRGATLINVAAVLLITPLVVFYLLVDWHAMIERVRLWLPRDHVATIEQLAGEINDAIAAFIRGQGAVCICLGLFYVVALSLVGLNYGAFVGVATGMLAFVPMIGWVIGITVATLIAVVQFAPKISPVLAVMGVMVTGMAIDTALLSPALVGKKVGLHPVWLIFALFAFSLLFGIVGTLVAVPVSAAIAVMARFGIARYLQSEVYSGRHAVEPIAPADKRP